MFVPHVLGFLPPPVVESVVSRGCSRLVESGSLYLVDPNAIIEVRGEEVLASTLDGDRMWRRGPGVPGGSELCLRVWFGTDMEMFSNYALLLLLLHSKPRAGRNPLEGSAPPRIGTEPAQGRRAPSSEAKPTRGDP
jgi:hypothetical protein